MALTDEQKERLATLMSNRDNILSEIDIIKKISEWPKVISLSVKNLEPHRVPYYLYELSSLFHFFDNI